MTKKPPLPPPRLAGSREFWRQMTERLDFEAHELVLLQTACELLDEIEAAQAAIARDGQFVRTPRGVLAAHPAAKAIRDSRAEFRLLLGKLDLRHVGR